MQRLLIALSAAAALAAPAVAFGYDRDGPDHRNDNPGLAAMHRHKHVPKGTDAICKDGTYSSAGHHSRRNCVGHGGVARWW